MTRFLFIVLGAWIGVMLFFTFGATPPLFRGLGSEQAGQAVNLIFPSYYAAQALCGGVALLLLVLCRGSLAGWRTGLILLLIPLAAVALNQFYLGPAMAEVPREIDPERFARLHGLAMVANVVGFLFLVAASLIVRNRKR